MTEQRTARRRSLLAAWLNLLLMCSVGAALPLAAFMAHMTVGTPWEPYRHRIWITVGVCGLAWVAAVVLGIQRLNRKPSLLADLARIAAGLLALLAPPIARLAIPWEEPGTGMGSPLAVLIGVSVAVIPTGVYLAFALGATAWMNRSAKHGGGSN